MAQHSDVTAEHQLVAAARNGDKGAFMRLVKRHDAAARAVAYSITLDRDLMDDVLQDSYLKAYRSIHRLRADTSFRPWICKVVRNASVDALRRRRSVTRFSSDEMHDNIADIGDLEESVTSAHDVVLALGQLPEQQRIAIRLIDGEGLPYRDVAEILEVSIGTLSSRVNAARSSLRKLLTATSQEDEVK